MNWDDVSYHTMIWNDITIGHPVHQNTVEFSTFLTDFQSFLTVAANTPNNFIITGDFNIHINKESDTNRIRFMEILDSFNLTQLVSVATHIEHNSCEISGVPCRWTPGEHLCPLSSQVG